MASLASWAACNVSSSLLHTIHVFTFIFSTKCMHIFITFMLLHSYHGFLNKILIARPQCATRPAVCIIINLGDSQLASGRSLNNKFARFFATLTEQAQDEPFTGRRRQKNWSAVLLHVEKEMNNEWLLILKKKIARV